MAADLNASFTLTLKDNVSKPIQELEKRLDSLRRLTATLTRLGDVSRSMNVGAIAAGAAKSEGALARLARQAVAAKDAIASIGSGLGGSAFGRLRTHAASLRGELGGMIGQARALAGDVRGLGHGALTLAATGFGFNHVIGKYAEYEDINRHIAITAGVPQARLPGVIGDQMATYNQLGLETAQSPQEIAKAAMFLLTDGLSKATVDAILPSIAKAATAYRGSVPDGVAMAFTMHQNLGVHEEDMPKALAMAALAGRSGHVSFADQSRLMQGIAPSAAGAGMTGVDGTAKLLAMLETVKRGGAGTSDHAAIMLTDFFDYLNSPFGKRSFAHGGIDLQKLMLDAEHAGTNPVEAVLSAIHQRTSGMTRQEAANFRGTIFHNSEARKAAAALENQASYRGDVEARLLGASSSTIKEDADKAFGPETKLRSMNIQLEMIEQRFGKGLTALLDPFNTVLAKVLTGLDKLDDVLGRIRGGGEGRRDKGGYEDVAGGLDGIIGYTGGLLALLAVLPLLAAGLRILLTPLRWLFIGMRLLSTGAAFLIRGLIAVGIAALGVSWPILAIIAAITLLAVAAYLIYRYWRPIKGWFGRLWEGIKQTFNDLVTWLSSWADRAIQAVKTGWDGLKGWFTGLVAQWTQPFDDFIRDIERRIETMRNSGVGRALGLGTGENAPSGPHGNAPAPPDYNPGALPGGGYTPMAYHPGPGGAPMSLDVRVRVDQDGRIRADPSTPDPRVRIDRREMAGRA